MGQKDKLIDNTHFFQAIINSKAPYFFYAGFRRKTDAAALFHFLPSLNKKYPFQTQLLLGEEIWCFPTFVSMYSSVGQLTEIAVLSL